MKKNNEKESLKKILKVWSESGRHYECINGSYFPAGCKSKHHELPISSKELGVVMKTMLETLSVFHRYAEDNNILYSLHAGSLLGYYRIGGMIPWDDDIDIKVRKSDMVRLRDDLWKDGKPLKKVKKYKHGWGRDKQRLLRGTRVVNLYGRDYELISADHGSFRNGHPGHIPRLFKLRPAECDCFDRVVGGLDISFCIPSSNRKKPELYPPLGCSWIPRFPCVGPSDDDGWENYPIVKFGGIETRAAVRELGEPVLDKQFGPKWRIPCHPMMKK